MRSITEIIEDFHIALKNYVINQGKGINKNLALGAGVSESYISQLVRRKKPASKQAVQEGIAKAAGCKSVEDFLKRWGPAKEDSSLFYHSFFVNGSSGDAEECLHKNADYYRGVPLYESGKLAARYGGYTFDDEERPDSTVIVYRPELPGRTNHDLRAVRVGGDSMHPMIPKGSIVIVDLSDRDFVDKKIWVIREPSSDPPTAMVKYVQQVDQKNFKGLALISENRQYFPEFTDLEWHELVVGRAVWVWRSLEEV